MNNSQSLYALGQSIWFDNIQRSLLEDGTLRKMISNGEIYGVTSNPSIFNQAISKSSDYDEAMLPMALSGCSTIEIYDQLVKEDIRLAADEFHQLYVDSNGLDGYVSVEVDPTIAHDATKMIDEARSIWKTYDRQNLMIKIPATLAGIESFTQLTSEGINVNVTLIFTLSRYRKVIEAYFSGLEKRLASGNAIDHISSVASFFVSRVDTKVDGVLQILSDSGSKSAKALFGKTGIANARLAYDIFSTEFDSKRFGKLKGAGARVQRPLWASTGTKNPAYSDVLYVDELIGSQTVNTMPPKTLTNFLDHGKVSESLHQGINESHSVFAELEKLGVSPEKIGEDLETEGLVIFSDAYNQLLQAISAKKNIMIGHLGSLSEEVKLRVDLLDSSKIVDRLYAKDGSVWTEDTKAYPEIEHRLGWLDLPEKSMRTVDEIYQFRDGMIAKGYKHIFLLGMGGSSLAPEVYKLVFGSKLGLELIIVDSTDPDQIRTLARSKPMKTSLFIVSSKSGGTSEINAFLDYFWHKCKKEFDQRAGDHFVAITDPGTSLDQKAKDWHFYKIFLSDPDVGGRYSALTPFGLVPAALLGIDLHMLLAKAKKMADHCRPDFPIHRNPGLVIGAVLGQAAISGKEKLSIFADKPIRPFADWLEQLIAESTGKSGVGILPVIEEFTVPMKIIGNDRITVYLRVDGSFDDQMDKLARAGHPVVIFNLIKPEDLFGEYFRWEIATAVACSILKVNSFDQPDVQDSKSRTINKINELREKGKLVEPPVVWENSDICVYSSDGSKFTKCKSLPDVMNLFLAGGQKGDYVAINAYLPYDQQIIKSLIALRKSIQLASGYTTTRGFGPRFLHSTGQLHKGGTSNGLFIQITRDPIRDYKFGDLTFGNLERAQSLGDYESLISRGRKVIRVHIKGGDVTKVLKEISQ